MNRRGWVGWIEQNPVAAAVLAFVTGIGLASGGFLAADVGVGDAPRPSVEGGVASGTTDGGTGTTGDATAGDATTGDATTGDATGDGTTGGETTGGDGTTTTGDSTTGTGATTGTTTGDATTGDATTGDATTGDATTGDETTGDATTGDAGTTGGQPAGCQPQPGYEAIGLTEEQVRIGTIVSDVSQLPAQLRPVYEGLQAYVKRVNDRGGVCGRRIEIDYANDNANPSALQSSYSRMKDEVFSFVGLTSLVDQSVYQQQPPFNPNERSRDGTYAPDLGGQAYSYNRSQSSVHASPLGSLSPVLTGGTAFVGFQEELAADGRACEKVGFLYLIEPNGSSEDQADLGRVAVESSWGLNLGSGSTQKYQQTLAASVPQYELTVNQMLNDGMDCAFTYADLQSNINFVRAAANQQAWPPDACPNPTRCFDLIYTPYTAYDTKFINDLGATAKDVRTFVPHIPLDETDNATLRNYVADLKAVDPGFRPSTYSIAGYASGAMFVDALRACGVAPTRACLLEQVAAMKDWGAGGLMAPITPFRSTRATLPSHRNINWGTWDFRWVFHCSVRVRVVDVGGGFDFRRSGPPGYECGGLHVARGPDREP